jgi:hypothetical protein
MKIQVYHAQNTHDSLFYRRDGKIYNATQALAIFVLGGYDFVGEFETPSTLMDDEWNLEKVYEKTQNINEAWNKKKPCRSTSVGDILKFGDDLYIVASFGFEKL